MYSSLCALEYGSASELVCLSALRSALLSVYSLLCALEYGSVFELVCLSALRSAL